MSYVKPDVTGRIYHNRLNFVNRYIQPPLDNNLEYIERPSFPISNVPRFRSISPVNIQLPPISPEKLVEPLQNNTKDIPTIDREDFNRRFINQPNLGSNVILNSKYPENSYRDLMLKQLYPTPRLNLDPIEVNLNEIKPSENEPILRSPNYVWIPPEKKEEPINLRTIGIPRRRRIINYEPELGRTLTSFNTPNNRTLSSSNLNQFKPNQSFYFPRVEQPLSRHYRSSSNYPRRFMAPSIQKNIYEVSPTVKQSPGGKIYSNYKYYNIQPRKIFLSRYNPEPISVRRPSFVEVPPPSPPREYVMMRPVPVYYEQKINSSPAKSYLNSSPANFKPQVVLVDNPEDPLSTENQQILQN